MKISIVNYDIHSRKPIDKKTALIMSNGNNFVSNKSIFNLHSEIPLKTRKFTNCEIKSSTLVDLTGIEFGRFKVIGLYAFRKKSWVVRCSCGIYTTRKAKAIKNINNINDCCEECRHLQYLQQRKY